MIKKCKEMEEKGRRNGGKSVKIVCRVVMLSMGVG